ncbi:MAG: hypothetical protein GX055_03010 [Desulfovibrionales bacterium]|nr:hypothetical protein [Desulfovibrionales bacterium]
MAQLPLTPDPFSLQEQLKNLGDEELLDFWEESQLLDHFLEMTEAETSPSLYYETAILYELRLRTCRGHA